MNGTHTLAAAYQQVLSRIHAAATRCGRDPASVTLLAVSKTRTADEVAALAALGQRAMGENYLQEALDKQATLDRQAANHMPGAPDGQDVPEAQGSPAASSIQWHFIGPIQSNKTRKIAEHFDWVHSVENLRIGRRLSEQRPPERGPLDICLQVNVSGEASKSGCAPEEAVELALSLASLPRLRLRGLMAIPEPTEDEALQRQRFESLRALHRQIREQLAASSQEGSSPASIAQAAPPPETPPTDGRSGSGQGEASASHQDTAGSFDTLSMGMSDDLEAAIAAGSTMVRIGTAIFGPRPRKDVQAQPVS
ncbi:MAG: YggS family pyridoxal phosphate-dependent enzyme [Lautropia sp.]|nr:YggS family pyridoxal phosphate-dependent enzyme [Lautropia sp.]